jgi:DNA-binding CsgD family transcriptional regulator
MTARHICNDLVCSRCREPVPLTEVLSRSEYKVLLEIATGKSHCRIARDIHRSPRTVETYARRIRHKLGVPTVRELIVYCWERNLLRRPVSDGCVHHR